MPPIYLQMERKKYSITLLQSLSGRKINQFRHKEKKLKMHLINVRMKYLTSK